MSPGMSQDEGDSLGGRLGRYARVGSSVGGLAVKLAGQRYLGWTSTATSTRRS